MNHLVGVFTDQLIATNCGEEHVNEKGLPETIDVEYQNGPFLVLNCWRRRLQLGK